MQLEFGIREGPSLTVPPVSRGGALLEKSGMIFLSRPKNRVDAGLGQLDLAVSMIEEVELAGVADLLPPAAIRLHRALAYGR